MRYSLCPAPTCNRRDAQHRGAVLILVLAAMLVASLLMAIWARAAIDRHRRLQGRDQALQAAALADSGMARAAARLAAVDDYSGEEWKISADQLQRRDPALVTIEVQPVADQPQLRTVTVIADFPIDPTHRTRKRRSAVINLTKLGEQP